MDSTKKPKMNPEILKDGVAVCRKECEAWKKETASTNKGTEVKVRCQLRSDKDNEVHPRAVCAPWSNFLLVTNQKLSEMVATSIEVKAELMSHVERLNTEIKSTEKEGLEIRSELSRAKKKIGQQEGQITRLKDSVETAKLKQREAWEGLKEVQDHRSDKKRYDERLEKLAKDNEKLTGMVASLEASNKHLTREDVSKSGIIKELEKQIEILMGERRAQIATKKTPKQAAPQPDAQ